MSIPKEAYDVLGLVCLYVSGSYFIQMIKLGKGHMNKESKENTFDVIVALLILMSLGLSIYSVRLSYINNLLLERKEGYRAKAMTLKQSEELLDEDSEAMPEVPKNKK